MREKTEAKIQQEMYLYFNNTFCLKHHKNRCVIFSVPNDSSSKEETMRKLATGMLPGASDLIIIFPGKLIFVEVKTDTGRQSDVQKEFEKRVNALGFEYWLVRSLEEFKTKLSSL